MAPCARVAARPARGAARRPRAAPRCLVIRKAKGGEDAAKKALQEMFGGREDVLKKNERASTPPPDDGGDDAGTGGGGRGGRGGGIANVRASVAEWWDGFRAGMDPWLKFVSGAAVLFACSVALDLVEGGWKHMPDVLRLNKSSAGGLRRLESSRVVDTDGKLGSDEASIIGKYGGGNAADGAEGGDGGNGAAYAS